MSREEAKKDANEVVKAYNDRVGRAIDVMLRTPEGREVFMHLFRVCGYNKTNLRRDAMGKVETDAMLFLEAQREIYISLRTLMSPELRVPMEAEADLPILAEEKK